MYKILYNVMRFDPVDTMPWRASGQRGMKEYMMRPSARRWDGGHQIWPTGHRSYKVGSIAIGIRARFVFRLFVYAAGTPLAGTLHAPPQRARTASYVQRYYEFPGAAH